MADIGAQLNSLSPEQRQAVMMQAQQEANQTIMQELMKEMVTTCFEKCSGTSVRIIYYYNKMCAVLQYHGVVPLLLFGTHHSDFLYFCKLNFNITIDRCLFMTDRNMMFVWNIITSKNNIIHIPTTATTG
jgi:hypothetical protein